MNRTSIQTVYPFADDDRQGVIMLAVANRKASKGKGKASIVKATSKGKASKATTKSNTAKPTDDRIWGLVNGDLKALLTKAKAEKTFPNPYRASSNYGAIISALASLGVNKFHTFKAFK